MSENYISIDYNKIKMNGRGLIKEEFSNPFGVFWVNIIAETDKPELYEDLCRRCVK